MSHPEDDDLDIQFTTLHEQNAQNSSLDIYIILYLWVFLHVSIYNDSSSGKKYQM